MAGEPGEDLLHTVGHLDQLVGQSMLTVRQRAGRSWYGLLDTLRAFARTRLAERSEQAAVRDRLVDALVGLAGDVQHGIVRAASLDAWSAAHAAGPDLQEALRWCLEHDERPDRAVELLRPLTLVVYSARAEPVAELADAVLARWSDPTVPGWADAAAVAAFAHVALRHVDRGAGLAAQALDARLFARPARHHRRAAGAGAARGPVPGAPAGDPGLGGGAVGRAH